MTSYTIAHDRLSSALRGELIGPGDGSYETARRVWNGMVDRRPAMIAMCEGTADVIACLDAARDEGLRITVRGGGHSVAGRAVADDALVIDLSRMRSVQVDPTARTARVGAGATWGIVDHETQAFGLAMTGGVDSRTGVGGLTLGGGLGYLGRRQGLTIDHLVSAEVVLADGQTVVADDDHHPELFWALRGGGGNFGVVTSFEFRLHELGPDVMHAQVFFPIDQAADTLAFYRDFAETTSEDVGCYALFIDTPPVEPFPEKFHGQTCLALVACHAGSLERGESELGHLAAYGSPMFSVVAPIPYAALQSSFDAGAPDGGRYYWKARYLDELSDAAISLLVEKVTELPGAFSNVFIEPMGGAIARVDPGATAFPHRNASFGFGISSGWVDPANDGAAIAWTRELFDEMLPHASSGAYSNYMDTDDGHRTDEAFGANLSRLREVKERYDPGNVFNLPNQKLH